ncbi:MAG TPA: hemolysin family protein [Caldilineaceae bacterium]|nr:hemolysin family protein [Caldilineaceae bacterium]
MEPDPIPVSLLLIAFLTIGFAAAAEAGMAGASRSTIRKLSEEGNRQAKIGEQLLREPAQVALTMMVLKTAAVLVAGAALARLLAEPAAPSQVALAAAGVWLALLLFQAAARGWGQGRATEVLLALAQPVRLAVWGLWPVAALVRRVGRMETNGLEEPVEEALRSAGLDEEEEPILDSEKEMIASILEMDETVAREVMVPRIDVVAIPVETSLREALRVIIEAGHSRVPVYEENIDHIVGFLYAKDLLKWLAENGGDVEIRTLLRPATFVPASKKVNLLLREMQRNRIHIAMVVDEYGGTAGLVTIEDIIEEIVGEIQDEYDLEEEVYIQLLGPNTYLLNARLDLYSLAKLLDTELPEEDADTLGGMIYSVLGHVPEPGESVVVGGWLFTVLALDGRRIDQVRAEPAGRPLEGEEPVKLSNPVVPKAAASTDALPNFSASD